MSLKKTDMVKNLARKLDGKRKAAGVPQRFAQGSAELPGKPAQPADKARIKLVPVACRLPADLAARLRDQAVKHEGGVNAVVAEAVERWLLEHSAAK